MSQTFEAAVKNGIYKIESIEDFVESTKIMYCKMQECSHYGFPINRSSVVSYFSNPQRFKDCFCFEYYTDNQLVSFIWWIKAYDARVNKKIIQEYAWISDSDKKGCGIKLFKKSLEYIKNIYKFDVILTGNREKHPKLEKFYKKNGFKVESSIFYKSN